MRRQLTSLAYLTTSRNPGARTGPVQTGLGGPPVRRRELLHGPARFGLPQHGDDLLVGEPGRIIEWRSSIDDWRFPDCRLTIGGFSDSGSAGLPPPLKLRQTAIVLA